MATIAQHLTRPFSTEVYAGTAEQHSIVESLTLHLLPGLFIVAVFVLTAPLAIQAGLPPMLALIVGAAVGLGFQAFHLFREGFRRNGRISLQGTVLYREPIPVWQYLVLVPAFAVVAFLINGITAPLGAFLVNQFAWLPDWFEVRNIAQLAYYSRPALVTLFALSLLVNGITAPIIEELYFRGYLMPRLSRFGRWAPVVEAALFTLYHFWQPYYWITQFLSMLPVVVAVAWKRNIKLGILTHATLNIVGALLTFGMLLG